MFIMYPPSELLDDDQQRTSDNHHQLVDDINNNMFGAITNWWTLSGERGARGTTVRKRLVAVALFNDDLNDDHHENEAMEDNSSVSSLVVG